MRTVTLYHRSGCHLCDEMKKVVESLGGEIPLRLEEVDIETDADLVRRYGNDIPVLLIDEQEAFRHRVTPGQLRRALRSTNR